MARRTRAPRRPRRRVMRKRMMRKRSTRLANSEFASAKQTIALPNDTMGTLYDLSNINLSQFDRLVQVARAYQFFRFTKIEVKFMPYTDTYISTSVPYLHWVINKSDNLVASSFNQLRDAGAKQIRFDDNSINVSWKPSVQVGVAQAQPPGHVPDIVAWSSYRTSPWLSTENLPSANLDPSSWAPSTVPHRGLLYGVEQDYPNPEASYYGISITVHAQYKKPSPFALTVTAPQPRQTKEIIPKDEVVAA